MALVIITGAPGTGKTTLAAHLAKAAPHGLHIPADLFFEFPAHPISPYRPEAREQNTHIIIAATRAAATFAEGGYEVFLDGIFGPWFVPLMLAELRTYAVAVHYVVLQAPLDTTARRVEGREGNDRQHVVTQMHAAFADLGAYRRHRLDTQHRGIEAIAGELTRRLTGGDFILDLSNSAS